MNFLDACEVADGDELFLRDGVGRPLTDTIVEKVAGPFYDGIAGVAVMLVRRQTNQKLGLYNLGELVPVPPVPKEGETWFHRVDGPNRSRYIAGVTSNHVVLKADKGRPDNKAHVMELNEFVRTFKRAK